MLVPVWEWQQFGWPSRRWGKGISTEARPPLSSCNGSTQSPNSKQRSTLFPKQGCFQVKVVHLKHVDLLREERWMTRPVIAWPVLGWPYSERNHLDCRNTFRAAAVQDCEFSVLLQVHRSSSLSCECHRSLVEFTSTAATVNPSHCTLEPLLHPEAFQVRYSLDSISPTLVVIPLPHPQQVDLCPTLHSGSKAWPLQASASR